MHQETEFEKLIETYVPQNLKILREYTGLPFQIQVSNPGSYKINAVLVYNSFFNTNVANRFLWYSHSPLNKIWQSVKIEEIILENEEENEQQEEQKENNSTKYRLTIPNINVHKSEEKSDFSNATYISELTQPKNKKYGLDFSKMKSGFLFEETNQKLKDSTPLFKNFLQEIKACEYDHRWKVIKRHLDAYITLISIYHEEASLAIESKEAENEKKKMVDNIFSMIDSIDEDFKKETHYKGPLNRSKIEIYSLYLNMMEDVFASYQKLSLETLEQLGCNLFLINSVHFWKLRLSSLAYNNTENKEIDIHLLERILMTMNKFLETSAIESDPQFFLYYRGILFLLLVKSNNFQLVFNFYRQEIEKFGQGVSIKEKEQKHIDFFNVNTALILELFKKLIAAKLVPNNEILKELTILKNLVLSKTVYQRVDRNLFEVDERLSFKETYKIWKESILEKLDDFIKLVEPPKIKKKKKKPKKNKLQTAASVTDREDKPVLYLEKNPCPWVGQTLLFSAPPTPTIRISAAEIDADKERKKNKFHKVGKKKKNSNPTTESSESKTQVFILHPPLNFVQEIRAVLSDSLIKKLHPDVVVAALSVLAKGMMGFNNNEVKPVYGKERKKYNLDKLSDKITHKIKTKVISGELKGKLVRIYGEWGEYKQQTCLIFKYHMKEPHTGKERVKVIKERSDYKLC